MRDLFLLLGISATGKGTRVSHLLEFMKTQLPYQCIKIQSVTDIYGVTVAKDIQLGILFPDLNMLFVGRWVKSNKSGLVSWSSLDGFSYMNEEFYNFLVKELPYNLVCEGYYGSKSGAWSPQTVSGYFNRAVMFHYWYNDMEELQQRVLGRSGSRIKGTCWSDNRRLLKEENRVNGEINYVELSKPCESIYKFKLYDENVILFGKYVVGFLGLDVSAYLKFSEENSTIRKVGDPQSEKILKYNSDKFDCFDFLYIDIDLRKTCNQLPPQIIPDIKIPKDLVEPF